MTILSFTSTSPALRIRFIRAAKLLSIHLVASRNSVRSSAIHIALKLLSQKSKATLFRGFDHCVSLVSVAIRTSRPQSCINSACDCSCFQGDLTTSVRLLVCIDPRSSDGNEAVVFRSGFLNLRFEDVSSRDARFNVHCFFT